MGTSTRPKRFKIGIFDPYLDALGGGERYVLSLVESLQDTASVDIFWHDQSIRKRIKKKLNIDIPRANIVPFPVNFVQKLIQLREYSLCIYVTDGSLFWSPAQKNILIIQSPAHIPDISSLMTKLKLICWPTIICYSEFVKVYITNRLKHNTFVLPPAVDLENFKPEQKENIILSTGRFFSHLHSKKQHLLVLWFRKLLSAYDIRDWKLVLIGSVLDETGRKYIKAIKQVALGLPVEIIEDASFTTLKKFYAKAKIFWLATGFGEDLKKYPEKAEHFGIVTVEAMASGCVPIVYHGGGQPEIITHGKDGYLFTTEEELLEQTKELILNHTLQKELTQKAVARSNDFSKGVFLKGFNEILIS